MFTMNPGDVAVFEADDSWLSQCIAKMTRSSVSHASMLYTEDTMVEMRGSGIQLNRFSETPQGEKIHLLRLSPDRDPGPLVKAAKRYLDEGVQYDFPDLVFFAGLLIYRSCRPTPRWQKITDLVLNAACAELDKLINKLMHRGGEAPVMVCSQLVYQCYFDCGDDYRIVLQDALLQDGLEQGSGPDDICLKDLLDAVPHESASATGILPPVNLSLEGMAREIMTAAGELETQLLKTENLHSTVNSAKRFLDLAERVLEQSGIDLPLPALFVAPSDLLNHAVNLRQYGTAVISRI